MSVFVEDLECRRLLSTYYVSTTGNDGNAGSQSQPFLTIQAAANVAVAGDIVNVESGTYGGFVLSWDNPQAGTSGAPITFQADPNAAAGSVIINSRDNKTPVAIDLEPGSDYITIKGFKIENDGSVTNDGIKATGNNDSMIDDTVVGVGDFGIFTDNANNALIEGCNISGTLGTDEEGHGIYISGTCSGVIIKDNIIDGNGYHGIHLNGDASEGGIGEVINATIEDNLIYNNPGNGINGDGVVDSIIENNVIYGFTNHGISLYQIDAGVGSTGNVIVNNTIDGGSSIELQDGATGNIIFNNAMTGSIDTDDTSTYTESNDIDSGNASSLFVNAAGGNYQLSASSSAIGAGEASFDGQSAPTTDILGDSRVSGRYDAGAYEYGGTQAVMPATPGSPAATQGTMQGGISVTWSAANGATSYQVFRSTTNNSSAAIKVGYAITGTSFDDTTAVAGQTYYYWVRGRNPTYIGSFSSAVSGFALGTPGSVAATQGTVTNGVNITWSATTAISSYQVFRSTTNDANTAIKIGFAITGTSFEDTVPVPGVMYYYWVRGRNPTAIGDFTSAVTGFAPLTIPTGVTPVVAQPTGFVSLSWNPVDNAASYQVFRSTTNDINTATKVGFAIVATSFLDTGTTTGQTYYYWIRARNPVGIGLSTSAIVVNT